MNSFNVILQSWHNVSDVNTHKKKNVSICCIFSHYWEILCSRQQRNGSCTYCGSNAAINWAHRAMERARKRKGKWDRFEKSVQPPETPNQNWWSTCGQTALWPYKIWCLLSINLKKKKDIKVQSAAITSDVLKGQREKGRVIQKYHCIVRRKFLWAGLLSARKPKLSHFMTP